MFTDGLFIDRVHKRTMRLADAIGGNDRASVQACIRELQEAVPGDDRHSYRDMGEDLAKFPTDSFANCRSRTGKELPEWARRDKPLISATVHHTVSLLQVAVDWIGKMISLNVPVAGMDDRAKYDLQTIKERLEDLLAGYSEMCASSRTRMLPGVP